MKKFYFFSSNVSLQLILTALFLSVFLIETNAQNIAFPDDVLKEILIDMGYDTNQDGIIQLSEGMNITTIESTQDGLRSLLGIEELINLEFLEIRIADLGYVDLSANTKLQHIEISSCKLDSINLSNLNPIFLNLRSNNLTEIDLSSFTNLERLDLIANEIANIDLSANTALLEIDLGAYEALIQVDLSSQLNLESLHITSAGITSLDIAHLTNLTELDLYKLDIQQIDISTLNKLIKLELGQCNLEEVNMSNHQDLELVNISVNNIARVDLTNLPNLETLKVHWNPLEELDLSGNPKLEDLEAFNIPWKTYEETTFHPDARLEDLNIGVRNFEEFGEVDFSLPIYENLINLQLDHETDVDYDFSPLSSLRRLNYSGPMKIIDLNAQSRLIELKYGRMQNEFPLEIILINNGTDDDRIDIATHQSNLNITNICCDVNQIDKINDWAAEKELETSITSYCAFNNFENKSSISGAFSIDPTLSSCSTSNNNVQVNRQRMTVEESGNIVTYITEPSGEYNLALIPGFYNITPEFNNNYFTSNPENANISIQNMTTDIIQNFELSAAGEFQDLNVSLMPILESRPGFKNTYLLKLSNDGSTCNTGSIQVAYDQEFTEFISTLPTASNVAQGVVTFDYELVPFESLTYELTFEHNTPGDASPLNGDDILSFTVSDSNGAFDETPEDNTFVLQDLVVNSFDPNDIVCLEGKQLHKTKVGDFVHYRIRFENTGTASAINVVVQNSIDLEKFEFETLEIIESSHSVLSRLLDGGSAEFIFADINLPFDDANNDGYILYKIRTKETLQVNDEFSNQAAIYFDFNLPIITEIYTTTIFEDVTSIKDNRISSDINIYPNPTTDILYIGSEDNEIELIEIYNLQGQLISTHYDTKQVEVSSLSKGTYILKIADKQGNLYSKKMATF